MYHTALSSSRLEQVRLRTVSSMQLSVLEHMLSIFWCAVLSLNITLLSLSRADLFTILHEYNADPHTQFSNLDVQNDSNSHPSKRWSSEMCEIVEQTNTVRTEEEASEVGLDDIVIHLIDPYKCGVCEVEFLDKPVFKEHMLAHLEHTKQKHPSSQIEMNITVPPQASGGMTVTRDIVHLREDGSLEQVWQPVSISENQPSPLRELQEAGLIKFQHLEL